MTDPLVEEARKAGQAYIDSFKGDLRAVCGDLRRRARQEGRTVVSLPAKPPVDRDSARSASKKKAG
jgi:hypothetical protein